MAPHFCTMYHIRNLRVLMSLVLSFLLKQDHSTHHYQQEQYHAHTSGNRNHTYPCFKVLCLTRALSNAVRRPRTGTASVTQCMTLLTTLSHQVIVKFHCTIRHQVAIKYARVIKFKGSWNRGISQTTAMTLTSRWTITSINI